MTIAKIPLIRTFGRTRRRSLSARRQHLIKSLLSGLAPDAFCGGILEIGFGTGEHLIELAAVHPDKTIIGAEPFINGVASLLSRMADESGSLLPQYANIRIWPDDVRKLLSQNSGQFEEIWILHPDPWPKGRHEKRRLLSAEFLKSLSSFILKDGRIIIGTDHDEYYDWIFPQANLAGLKIAPGEFNAVKTRYHEKNICGGGTKYIVLTL
ncbi:MAG: hypothetical protein LBB08_00010 [Rickettsiales bacterium]|jgi:tRNA (guanine-N7-)-methyltransferase|nr:hypothetical protein [Rickettsiales bacterium]